jgi:hypothetical protein
MLSGKGEKHDGCEDDDSNGQKKKRPNSLYNLARKTVAPMAPLVASSDES